MFTMFMFDPPHKRLQNRDVAELCLRYFSTKHLQRVRSFRQIQIRIFDPVNPLWKRILDLKTDFAFLSANPDPDIWSGESFMKKDLLDLKSEETKSRLTD